MSNWLDDEDDEEDEDDDQPASPELIEILGFDPDDPAEWEHNPAEQKRESSTADEPKGKP